VAGVVGSTAQRGLEAARRLGVDRAYPDLDAMLGDRSVDVVHNCTPNDVHREVSAGALAAGKHVLSEKPLGLDSAETAALVEAAADLGRLHEERIRPAGQVETFARAGAGATRYPVDTEDFGSVLLRFASGARGTFVVSQVSAGRKNRLWLEVDTPGAAFAWDQEEPNHLWIGRRGEPNRDLPRDPALLGAGAAPLAHYPGGHQ